jgi:hypothetical protein
MATAVVQRPFWTVTKACVSRGATDALDVLTADQHVHHVIVVLEVAPPLSTLISGAPGRQRRAYYLPQVIRESTRKGEVHERCTDQPHRTSESQSHGVGCVGHEHCSKNAQGAN